MILKLCAEKKTTLLPLKNDQNYILFSTDIYNLLTSQFSFKTRIYDALNVPKGIHTTLCNVYVVKFHANTET